MEDNLANLAQDLQKYTQDSCDQLKSEIPSANHEDVISDLQK